MSNLTSFAKFGNYQKKAAEIVAEENAISYTRVSTKEQMDNNMSLKTQRGTIDTHSERKKIPIIAYFGGTHESAKTDGRKEFQRMLDFIKQNKGKIKYLFVYTLDRFSRTGGAAIALKNELRRDYGVIVEAVTQPADTSTASGILQQDVQLIFSHHDNQLRRQKTITSMRDKFADGIWVCKPPQGYDTIKVNGIRSLVVNEVGKKLRYAFHWKAEGMKNEEIIQRLKAIGLHMYKQQLTKIFKRPFYCGIINHGLLDGIVVEGKHEALISKEIFLKINGIHEQTAGYGVAHKKERDEIPLKTFIKCSCCEQSLTGYVVKAKNLWYYKCNTKGCKLNRSATLMHNLFEQVLSWFTLNPRFCDAIKVAMRDQYFKMNKENVEKGKFFREQLAEVNKKIENIEEKYYALNEMTRENFDRFFGRLDKERDAISSELEKCSFNLSNLDEKIDSAIKISSELAVVWRLGDTGRKEKLQKLLFPNGIIYDREKGCYRTTKINFVFLCIADLLRDSTENKKGDNHFFNDLSPFADRTGLEPATSAVTGRHSNQLNYRSFL